ncbi:cyclic-di-AMP receptor [Catenisphaera adipataccumulans]|uniref:Uncharacterized protein YaaQ n=1 Tax=Catenisphaera adipataccumulans TaxID=700500 RepID=A0A7W8FUD2_9FIRM|nr:cyclic-di-AMP receptor [Catenisphaera adipataccumulans]MBB5182469.1 uncharacterized protein YaaQ [Catenisphaera adipataccumulans]
MKLVLAIVSNDDASACVKALVKKHFYVTKLSSSGGFLRAGNTTLIIGCEEDEVGPVIKILGAHSSRRKEVVQSTAGYDMGVFTSFPMEITVGGATIFVLSVDQFYKL